MNQKGHYSILFFLLFAVLINHAYAQRYNNDNRFKVLRNNKIGREYRFNGADSTVTYLKYLGRVQTINRKSYKIITSIWIWGFSKHATSRILIFDDYNNYLGNYYVSTANDLPDHLEHNRLIFHNSPGSDCDTAVVTSIDLSKGLPKIFYRKCTKSGNEISGDSYSFSKD